MSFPSKGRKMEHTVLYAHNGHLGSSQGSADETHNPSTGQYFPIVHYALPL